MLAARTIAAHFAAMDAYRRAALPGVGDDVSARQRRLAGFLSRLADSTQLVLEARQRLLRGKPARGITVADMMAAVSHPPVAEPMAPQVQPAAAQPQPAPADPQQPVPTEPVLAEPTAAAPTEPRATPHPIADHTPCTNSRPGEAALPVPVPGDKATMDAFLDSLPLHELQALAQTITATFEAVTADRAPPATRAVVG